MMATFKGIRVKDNICDSCRHIEPHPKIEDKEHYLYCAANVRRRQKITSDVLERVREDATRPFGRLPCYWDHDNKYPHPPTELWAEVETFSATDAVKALIPKAWVAHLKTLPLKKEANLDKLVADCQRILVQGFYDCWKQRCKKFYALHRPDGSYCTSGPPT